MAAANAFAEARQRRFKLGVGRSDSSLQNPKSCDECFVARLGDFLAVDRLDSLPSEAAAFGSD